MPTGERRRAGAIRSALSHRDFRFLAAAQAVSGIGNWLYSVALIVYVFERTGSPGWVAATTIVRFVPYVILGSIGGVIADRHDRKKVMIWADAARGCLMTSIAVVAANHGSIPLLVGLATGATIFSAAYLPSVRASTPALVGEEDLAAANTVVTTSENVTMALGPAVGAVLLVLGSAAIAFSINAATFFLSAALTVPIRTRLRTTTGQDHSITESFSQRLTKGFRVILSSSSVGLVMLLTIAATIFYGQEIVLYTLTAEKRLGVGQDGVGFMFAAMGVGGILAASFVSRRLGSIPRQFVVLTVATIASAAPMAVLAIVSDPRVVYGLMLLEGAAVLVCDVVSLTVLQRLLPRHVLGRVLGISDSLLVAGILIGSLIAPITVRSFGLNAALLIGSALLVGPALVALPKAGEIDLATAERGRVLRDRVSVLSRIPLFEGGGAPMLESLAASAAEERLATGTVVIREGGEPDDLFVVVSGRLVVDSTGPHDTAARLAELGPGDYFGEIGLIERRPRTATVTASEESELLRISGSDFLSIANESPGVEGALRAVIAVRLARSQPPPSLRS